MQDTWLVTADGGVPLARLQMKIFDGTGDATDERAEAVASPCSPGTGGSRLRALPAHRRAALAAEGARTSGPTATSCSSRRCTRPPSSGSSSPTTEVAEATRLIGEGDLSGAIRLLRRGVDCLKIVAGALDMLEHLSPWEYQEVRKVLGHGSGFDSPGLPARPAA